MRRQRAGSGRMIDDPEVSIFTANDPREGHPSFVVTDLGFEGNGRLKGYRYAVENLSPNTAARRTVLLTRDQLAELAASIQKYLDESPRVPPRSVAALGRVDPLAAPFGWRSEKRPGPRWELVPVPAEQEALERMLQLRAAGASLAAIAAALTKEGFATKRGGQWYPATVNHILARVASTSG